MQIRSTRIFVSNDSIISALKCTICQQVFDDPTLLNCGHTFCYSCILIRRQKSKFCFICRDYSQLFDAELISKLKAKCCYERCTWIGEYGHLKRHQRRCEFKNKHNNEKKENFSVIDVQSLNSDGFKQQMQSGRHKSKQQLKERSCAFISENLRIPYFSQVRSQQSIESQYVSSSSQEMQQQSSQSQLQGEEENPIIISDDESVQIIESDSQSSYQNESPKNTDQDRGTKEVQLDNSFEQNKYLISINKIDSKQVELNYQQNILSQQFLQSQESSISVPMKQQFKTSTKKLQNFNEHLNNPSLISSQSKVKKTRSKTRRIKKMFQKSKPQSNIKEFKDYLNKQNDN